MLKNFFLVGLGGFFGAAGRYGVSLLLTTGNSGHEFPRGTFVANLLGCLFIGALAALFEYKWQHGGKLSSAAVLFFVTGFLGGFTTFSTFSFETLTLLRNHAYTTALLYALGSLVLGTLLAGLGYFSARTFSSF